jgi:hypothetical protein
MSGAAVAHLGSFTPADGYTLSVPSGGSANWCDVSYYNAGAYGPNSGGGSLTSIVPDSGLWRVTGQVGGFFTSSAARAAAVGGAPPYPVNVPSNTVPAYIVGNHFPGRGGDGSNLAVRNDTAAGTGDIKYQYSLDTFDTGGPVPSSVTSGVVTTQFYFMTDPGVPPNPGTRARDKFIMSFTDSLANIGVQWGYADDNEVYWRTNTSGAWNYTGVYATSADWDGVRMDIDLTNDTFGLDYYDVGTNTWSTMVPAGTALGTPMQNMTVLGWQLADAVNTGIGGKNFFDDFSFTVPEPSSAAMLLSMAGVIGLLRRRR